MSDQRLQVISNVQASPFLWRKASTMFSAISFSCAFFPALMAAITGALSPLMASAALQISQLLASSIRPRASLGIINAMHSVRSYFSHRYLGRSWVVSYIVGRRVHAPLSCFLKLSALRLHLQSLPGTS
jgi:hypothetical protein